jgi:hypothetical protein
MASVLPQSDRDVENNTRLFRATQQALALRDSNRPKNTSLAYEPKQREFIVRPLAHRGGAAAAAAAAEARGRG